MAESFTVRTPVEGYSGVIAGVVFDAGRAVVDGSQSSALRYFRDAGYHVERIVSDEQVTLTTVTKASERKTLTNQPPTVALSGNVSPDPARTAPAKKAAARKAPARKKKA